MRGTAAASLFPKPGAWNPRDQANQIYTVFLELDAIAEWLPPHGLTGQGACDGWLRWRRVPDDVHRVAGERRDGNTPEEWREHVLTFGDASESDVPTIVAVLNETAASLTDRFGEGHWSTMVTERGVLRGLDRGRLRLGRWEGEIETLLHLAPRKPWAIDVAWFTPVRRPLYLTSMAVRVARQGQGLGRLALTDALNVAREWPADGIRLDAYDAAAGAGEFYRRSGFRACGRVVYRTAPLTYYEYVFNGQD
ncbi:MAG: GNAT family N-acetyltransferase [Gemmatimonadota bacterium]